MIITLAQINPLVGDLDGNLERVLARLPAAAEAGADLIVFPEMCLSGYPPQDLVERPHFVEQSRRALDRLVSASRATPGLGIVVGLPLPSRHAGGKGVANAACLVSDGELLHTQEKSLLPTYDVFDEARYFDPADDVRPVAFKEDVIGISICEDAWNDPQLFRHRLYEKDPVAMLAAAGATVLVNISASPFATGKDRLRLDLMRSHARRHRLALAMVNEVGGNDQLVFDGHSLYVNADGEVCAALPGFEEATATVDTRGAKPVAHKPATEIENTYRALVLGTRDYLGKCGFSRAVVGVSGGVDSAVTLALAVDALGAENVRALAMPSPYSSRQSLDDATALCANLGVVLDVVAIADIMQSYEGALAKPFAGRAADVTEENIQARIRGNILMAYSNKFGSLVLSTGNKSELAVGYCTLYGDMSGGLAVISDVPKLQVYEMAEYINRGGERIPRSIIERVPSAELRADQKDSDTLPPYETLDAILDLYIEEGCSLRAIEAQGHDPKTVAWVVEAVRRNEYKRKQAAPGLKVTSKAFGIGRRFPVAARYDA